MGVLIMYALTPKGIGKKVGARSIRPDWGLAEGETFTVEDFNADMVLAEDGVSLREPTVEELAPTYQELRRAEYPPMEDYLDGIVKGDNAQVKKYIDACSAVKKKYPK